MKNTDFSELVNVVHRSKSSGVALVKMLSDMDPDGRKQKGDLTHVQYEHLKRIVSAKGTVNREQTRA